MGERSANQRRRDRQNAEDVAEFLNLPLFGEHYRMRPHPSGLSYLGETGDRRSSVFALRLLQFGVKVAVVYEMDYPYLLAEPWAVGIYNRRHGAVSVWKMLKALEDRELRSAYIAAVAMNLEVQGMQLVRAAIKRARP